MVEKFGKEQLCSGNGVLDVAGGRGAVAFELQVVHNIPTTVVDPRPQKLSRAQHKVIIGTSIFNKLVAFLFPHEIAQIVW